MSLDYALCFLHSLDFSLLEPDTIERAVKELRETTDELRLHKLISLVYDLAFTYGCVSASMGEDI